MDSLARAVIEDDVKTVQQLYHESKNRELVGLAVNSDSKKVLELLLTEANFETIETILPLAVKKRSLAMVKMLNETLLSIHGRHLPWKAMEMALEQEDIDIIRYSVAYIRDDYHDLFLRWLIEFYKNDLLAIKDLTKRMYQDRQIEGSMIANFLFTTYRDSRYAVFIAVLSAIFELLEKGLMRNEYALFVHQLCWYKTLDEKWKILVLEKFLVEHVGINPLLIARNYQYMCLDTNDKKPLYLLKKLYEQPDKASETFLYNNPSFRLEYASLGQPGSSTSSLENLFNYYDDSPNTTMFGGGAKGLIDKYL